MADHLRNSLVRAGNYDEAERLYREARDLAERNGVIVPLDAPPRRVVGVRRVHLLKRPAFLRH